MTRVPSVNQIQGLWKQQVGAAKTAWAKLTDDELLGLEGHRQKLAGLIQERYAVSRAAADEQVARFFKRWKT